VTLSATVPLARMLIARTAIGTPTNPAATAAAITRRDVTEAGARLDHPFPRLWSRPTAIRYTATGIATVMAALTDGSRRGSVTASPATWRPAPSAAIAAKIT